MCALVCVSALVCVCESTGHAQHHKTETENGGVYVSVGYKGENSAATNGQKQANATSHIMSFYGLLASVGEHRPLYSLQTGPEFGAQGCPS